MERMRDHIANGIDFNYITSVFEIFPSPLPLHIDREGDTFEIEDATDLFRTSMHLGFDELYLPDREVVTAKSGGNDVSFSSTDFVRWQLERFSAETLYYLINKVNFGVDDFMDADEEYEKDNDYYPDGWLSEYEEDSKAKGLELIERMRVEKSDDFYRALISGILDEEYGLLTHAETDILEDFSQSSNYDDWAVKLGVIFKGKFYPYIEAGNDSNLMMDNFKLYQIWVRNYDED